MKSGSAFAQCGVFICALNGKRKIFGLSLRTKANPQKAIGEVCGIPWRKMNLHLWPDPGSVILTTNEISPSIGRAQGLAVFQKCCAKFPAPFFRPESVGGTE